MSGDRRADGAEQEAADGASPPGPDNDHPGLVGEVEQGLARVPGDDEGVNLHRRMPPDDVPCRRRQKLLTLCAHQHHHRVVLIEPDGARSAEAADRVHDDERTVIQSGLAGCPCQCAVT